MRINAVCFLALCVLFFSCNKETPTPPIIPPPTDTTDPEPLRVVQSIYTHDDNGTLVNDTTNFSYDEEGRVTTKVYPGGSVENYTYSGDSLISIRQGTKEILRVPINVEQDSFVVDFIQSANSFTDTVQLTYIFNNNLHTEFWTYLVYKPDPCSCLPDGRHLQKEKNYYNSEGNLIKMTIQTPPNQVEGDRYTITAWDDKVNPKRTDNKLNALALSLPVPLESSSLHNPTVYHDSFTTYEVEMTYNDEGYPLTYKFKDKDYITARLKYNR